MLSSKIFKGGTNKENMWKLVFLICSAIQAIQSNFGKEQGSRDPPPPWDTLTNSNKNNNFIKSQWSQPRTCALLIEKTTNQT